VIVEQLLRGRTYERVDLAQLLLLSPSLPAVNLTVTYKATKNKQ